MILLNNVIRELLCRQTTVWPAGTLLLETLYCRWIDEVTVQAENRGAWHCPVVLAPAGTTVSRQLHYACQ